MFGHVETRHESCLLRSRFWRSRPSCSILCAAGWQCFWRHRYGITENCTPIVNVLRTVRGKLFTATVQTETNPRNPGPPATAFTFLVICSLLISSGCPCIKLRLISSAAMASIINLKYLALAEHTLKSYLSPTQEICAEWEAKVIPPAYPELADIPVPVSKMNYKHAEVSSPRVARFKVHPGIALTCRCTFFFSFFFLLFSLGEEIRWVPCVVL